MARSTHLDQAAVFAAIERLLVAGAYPTAARVREQLDGRGSPVVLQRFLGDWYEQHGPELARKAAAAPHKSPTDGLQAELKRLTASAVQEVEAAQAARIAALDDRAAALEGREAGLLAREQAQDAREAAHAELLADLREQLATANAGLTEANTRAIEEAGAYRAQVEALHAAGDAREAELVRLRPLAEQLPTLKATVDRAQADAAREQARVVELVGERDRLQRLASDRAAELAKVTGALERADAAAATQNASLAALRQQLQEARAALTAGTVRGETLTRELEQAQAGRQADAEQIEALGQAAAAADKERAVLVARLDAAQAEVKRFEDMTTGLVDLQDELIGLRSQLRQISAGRHEKPGVED